MINISKKNYFILQKFNIDILINKIFILKLINKMCNLSLRLKRLFSFTTEKWEIKKYMYTYIKHDIKFNKHR